jgi:hypothetical protein
MIFNSVEYPECLSRIPDTDFLSNPDLGFLIPDPKTATKERDENKLVALLFFVATKIATKFKIILVLNWQSKLPKKYH